MDAANERGYDAEPIRCWACATKESAGWHRRRGDGEVPSTFGLYYSLRRVGSDDDGDY